MNPEEQKEVQEQRAQAIARGVNWLGAATVGLFLATVAIAVVGFAILHGLIARNDEARQALCAQRHDLDQRIAQTKDLLDSNRGQQFIFAIPRTLLVSGLQRDEITRRNLEIIDCKGDNSR